MNDPADFECSRCATCCRNLLEDSGKMLRGLPLTEAETQLYPAEIVAPKLGVGITGPDKVILYQLNVNCCPHLNQQNQCKIYAKRPLMCRSFPIVAGAISNRCRMFSYRKPGVTYQEPYTMDSQVKASNKLEKYIEKQIMRHCKRGIRIWEFNLKTKKWVDKGPL
ncbi:MAG: YkgJ family cysteine cluster protein [Candidatus Bathyarchaeota archaeon]|nr:YkgJ family cysteine cluster protein [Candidatus Bathyarchaeota archaeon]